MERCAAGSISNLSLILPNPIASKQMQSIIHCKAHFPCSTNQTCFGSGLNYYVKFAQRPSTSVKSSPYTNDKSKLDGVESVNDTHLNDKKADFDIQPTEDQQEGAFGNISAPLLKFLEGFDIKLSYEELYPIVAYGGGGLVALWLAASILDAIESIPLFPKVLELVGLGFTIWFSSRFLIFKENRDELIGRIEHVKKQMLGSEDD
ncbi:protein CURVATURE THYLAKOID 1D, chloroplastic-like [Andrographis paniculata]|uniref:protein CURVATURE THYLAKOID 1D, chloroplastic-like n=1 Tax=Andrographis paniculata TaxID=175694 RepID=UPI0021E8CC08|nr:protein CURVATURE THYLAKOID 1D, chloroplastic-like [Andrographis paniculata]